MDGRRQTAYSITSSDKFSSLLGGASAYSPIDREREPRIQSRASPPQRATSPRPHGSLMTGRQRANARDCDTGVSVLSVPVDRLGARGRLCAGLMLEAGSYVWSLAKRTSAKRTNDAFRAQRKRRKKLLTRHDTTRSTRRQRHCCATRAHCLLADCRGTRHHHYSHYRTREALPCR